MSTLLWFVGDACTLAGVSHSSWAELPQEEQVRIIRAWETSVGTKIDFVKIANFKQQELKPKMETVAKPVDLPYDDFAKLDIRTGTIVSGDPVPKSKKLLKLQVDFGPEVGTRTILAGIAGTYSIDRLLGVQVVAVLNLAPRQMMGETSHGMLLAGHTTDGQLSLVQCNGVANGGSIG